MKIYLKQKVFTFLDKFTAKDAGGNDIYFVEGRLAFGKQLEIFDAGGKSVAYITQRLMSFMPRFEIEIGSESVCTVQREITFFSQSYTIEGQDWKLSGDFMAHEYQLLDRSNGTVMNMRRALFTWGDSYELNITQDENALLCLCIALAVDACIAVRKNNF